jgi:TonB family protein|uniref:TonB family protein n=1 Tax=candidate division WOR-3 bacterium TaxID=2052148 RepID=A0A7C4UBL0_UNCW3
MNRFIIISFLLHSILISILGFKSKGDFRKNKRIEVYKVSFAPMPVPIEEIKEIKKEIIKEDKNKSPFGKKTKERRLQDVTPQIETGSGKGFNYSYYLNILLSKIGSEWKNPYKGEDIFLRCVVYFEVSSDGSIKNVRIEEDSGNSLFNDAALNAVIITGKLPPLPKEFSEDYLKVHLEFLSGI